MGGLMCRLASSRMCRSSMLSTVLQAIISSAVVSLARLEMTFSTAQALNMCSAYFKAPSPGDVRARRERRAREEFEARRLNFQDHSCLATREFNALFEARATRRRTGN